MTCWRRSQPIRPRTLWHRGWHELARGQGDFDARLLHGVLRRDRLAYRLVSAHRWADVPDVRFLALGVRGGIAAPLEPAEGGASREHYGDRYARGELGTACSRGPAGQIKAVYFGHDCIPNRSTLGRRLQGAPDPLSQSGHGGRAESGCA